MTNVRKQKSGDQLTVGDWLAPGQLLDGAAEVLHVLKYRPKDTIAEDVHVHLVVREQGMLAPYADIVAGNWLADLASEEDLAAHREAAERAERIAEIRALADFLEANLQVPVPDAVDAGAHLDARHLNGPSVEASYATVLDIAKRLDIKQEERLDDRTVVRKAFGRVVYSVIAWHPDGRPAEPDADPTGLAYSCADEADDPTPVSGARVEPHTGAVTEAGPIDETPSVAECGCPVHPYPEGRGDGADTIVRHVTGICTEDLD